MRNKGVTQPGLIGLMMTFPEEVEGIAAAVSPEWFTSPYREAFEYLLESNGADAVSLAAAIDVPITRVADWQDCGMYKAFLKTHIANLEKEATDRKIKILGRQLMQAESLEDACRLVDQFGESLAVSHKTEPLPMKAALSRFHKELERKYCQKGKLLGMTTGLSGLDEKTEGFHRGDLVIVAGSASMGKTAFAMGCAESAAKGGAKVLIFSCEMTVEQLLMRSVASSSGVSLGLIRSARLEDHHFSKITKSVEEMHGLSIHIDDPAGISLSELTRKVRKIKRQNGLDLVVVDYLQIMRYDKAKEVQELDTITTNLKALAKELKICILLLSQLNRGSDREKRKPTMSDLRGSGMIENNADVILFPFRDAAYCQKCLDNVTDADHDPKTHQAMAEIIIGKQRQGERNISVKVLWMGERTRFVNIVEENYV